jgi:NADH dehydrogenase
MTRIVIVGGGYAGFYTALGLERKLMRSDEAEVILIDPRPYMTYQPFLPEVLAGSIEPRHVLVSLRKNLPRTRVISGFVVKISHADKSVVVRPNVGDVHTLSYDVIVVTAGAVTRTFPVAGLKREAIGLKHVEEAIAIRNRLLASFDQAAGLPVGPARRRLLTAIVVGGGFTGVEGFGELLSLAEYLLRYYPELRLEDLDFRLVQAASRIMPEMSERTAARIVKAFERRGAHVHLNTRVVSAVNGHVVLSTGEQFSTNVIIWAAGNSANPIIAKHTDLPVDSQGFLVVRADLRVGTEDLLIKDAWGAGDDASVPDLSGGSLTGKVVPNAQNAVRQGRVLAANVVAALRGRPTRQYLHHNLGTIATLGMGRGAFQSGRIGFTGVLAWLIHRAYHLYAVPTWERKARVLAGWLASVRFGRDIVSIEDVQHPRAAFVRGGFPRNSTDRVNQRLSAEIGQTHQVTQDAYLRQKVDSLAN